MIEIVLYDKTSEESMSIVRALRKQGLVQGTDFDFSHHHTFKINGAEVTRRCVTFKFYTDRDATMFALRWS